MGEVRPTAKAVAARLVEIAQSIEKRFVVEGTILGETGLRIDIAAARIHLDTLERRTWESDKSSDATIKGAG